MQLQDKIALIDFNPDDNRQHVAVYKQEQCDVCKEKQCLNICPTGVFKWDYQLGSPILVYYKQCVECGACRLACQFNNIIFAYPSGGFGVAYREG
ncbi:ferredoxin family protein [Sporomusa malonica]|uniref:Ferredoxin like protein n=1 Tax=Sporomusa malonica TaxID=112901 RepID=A0A1W2A5C6_9FIRM|nr:4Fe-4S dicluster domain-containing protein [Sporomusa malonica]SMC55783.1 ferredoxin like protein [Sporomusa malonica]